MKGFFNILDGDKTPRDFCFVVKERLGVCNNKNELSNPTDERSVAIKNLYF